ncbi:MAG: nitrous oxide reductase family maturation protein NosD [Promethearchaeota archaeon]
MKNTYNFKLLIFLMGICFTLSTYSVWTCIDQQLNNNIASEFLNEDKFVQPKSSGYWTTNFIHVDENWSKTVTDYNWCSGNGTWNNPYIIENVTIDASTSPTGNGILISNSKQDYFIINNCTVFKAGTTEYEAGIKLENTNNGVLINNNCSENVENGISLYSNCENNTITGNTANNNKQDGIKLFAYCSNNIISGNTIRNNDKAGILLNVDITKNIISGNTATDNGWVGIRAVSFCSNNVISENTANDNDYWGIYLDHECSNNTITRNNLNDNGGEGIYLKDNCSKNTISGNYLNDNGFNGVELWSGCSNNTISGNIVNDNIDSGIWLNNHCDNNTLTENIVFKNPIGIRLESDCVSNLIFYNCIFNNSNYNGIDNASNNWDNGVIGNYWSNYTGIDANHDGIGDIPYNVSGIAGNKDYKPIMNYNPFLFNPKDDLTYEVGTTGHEIKWFVINVFPPTLTFNVFRDGTSIKTGELYTYLNLIILNVDNLDIGTYGFTIQAEDGSGGIFTDGCLVIVKNTAPTFSATPADFSYEIGEIGNNMTWTFSDISTNNPTYTISRNGVPIIINNACTSGIPIIISVDSLDVGAYGFTIEVNDGYGAVALDTVWVSVVIDTSEGPNNLPLIITISIISSVAGTAGIVATTLYILRKRKQLS